MATILVGDPLVDQLFKCTMVREGEKGLLHFYATYKEIEHYTIINGHKLVKNHKKLVKEKETTPNG